MCNDRNPNPVAAACDDIAAHVADRERELIERLRNALRELRYVDRKFFMTQPECPDGMTIVSEAEFFAAVRAATDDPMPHATSSRRSEWKSTRTGAAFGESHLVGDLGRMVYMLANQRRRAEAK